MWSSRIRSSNGEFADVAVSGRTSSIRDIHDCSDDAHQRMRRQAMGVIPRVYLRVVQSDDAGAFIAATKFSRTLHASWVQPPLTAEEFASRMQKRHAAGNAVSMLAIRANDDALVGVFNLSEIIRGQLQQAFLGYYAFMPHAGQGYMREAMKLLLEHAFRPLCLHRIEANIQPANAASIELVRASGFVREGFSRRYLKIAGRWRDHERWAINADDWATQKRAGGSQQS